ncbi:MAG: hypothetical protein DGJ47_001084 [Rickettsiaceae bacterium]
MNTNKSFNISNKQATEQAHQFDQQVGRNIQYLRHILKISRQELADHIGVTQQQLAKYESAKNRISAGRLALVAHKLYRNINFFFEENKM